MITPSVAFNSAKLDAFPQVYKLIFLFIAGIIISTFEISPEIKFSTAINFWPLLFVALIFLLVRICNNWPIQASLFLSISVLSALGFAETLTGSHAQGTSPLIFGLSFYTAAIAYHAARGKLAGGGLDKVLLLANPLFLFTGPIMTRYRLVRTRTRAAYVAGSYIILGFFMFFVVAKNLTPFLALRDITSFWSALCYGVIFELFVYFNFCGLSLMIYGAARLLGLEIPLNFRQPFSARNIVEFWRGWHITLSTVLKELFYTRSKQYVSSDVAIFAVFIASAMWHGVTVNFVLWGLFHATAFVLTKYLLRHRYEMVALLALLPTLVLGRILFSENRTDLLVEKLHNIFSLQAFWAFPTPLYELALQYKTSVLCLLLGLGFILVEMIDGRSRPYQRRRYNVFRSQASIVLLVVMILFIGNTGGGDAFAVYGQR